MAASFSRLLSTTVLEVSELGFALLAGISIDTFVVRPLLVSAIAALLGRANWVWPFSRRAGALSESKSRAEAMEARNRRAR